MPIPLSTPSWSTGIAMQAGESQAPEEFAGLVLLAAPTLGHTGEIIYNLIRGPISSSIGGQGIWVPDKDDLAYAHTATGNATPWPNPQNWLPTGPITIMLDYEKRDGTNRSSAAFGFVAVTQNIKCGAHLPFNDGLVYWDYGGGSGNNRLTVSGQTFERAIWAFTNGPRGLEIWKNGIRRANSVTEVTRVSTTADWFWGRHSGTNSDLANYYQMRVYTRQLAMEELAAITIPVDAQRMLRRRSRLVVRVSAAAAITLTAAPGAYAWTGTAASLRRETRLTAAPGAYTMTGTDASLTAPTSGLPTLPLAVVDTTFPAPRSGATTHVCTTGAQFTTALSSAVLGDIIELQAGNTFAGPFTLPNKTPAAHSGNPDESEWIVIRSSAHASLPAEGTRATPAHASLMPTITCPHNGNAVLASNTAHHYRCVGVRFTPVSSGFTFALIQMGEAATTEANLPHHVIFDRCLMLADPIGGRRGLWFNAIHGAVIDSSLSGWREVGADSQAILVTNGPGPYTFINNSLEAAGENIMVGGQDPSIANLIPSDITFQRNHCFKPLSWKNDDGTWDGTNWTVKNLFEFKSAQRALVEGNLFEHNWQKTGQGDQAAFAIVFTVRNQDGGATWTTIDDVTFRHNIVRHTGSGVNILGRDDINTSGIANRMHLQNNLFEDLDPTVWGGAGRWLQFGGGPTHVVIEHNTAFPEGTIAFDSWGLSGLIFRDNISRHAGGIVGDGTGVGNDTIDTYWRFGTEVLAQNVLAGDNALTTYGSAYTAAECILLDSLASVGFVDLGGGNYRLTTGSPYHNAATDSTDIGVDFDALEAAQGAAPSNVLATDNFNRADGGLGANWTSPEGYHLVIADNQALGQSEDVLFVSAYTGISWPDDQYAQCVLSVIPSTFAYGVGPCVRLQPGSRDGYYATCSSTSVRVQKRVSGTFTQLGVSTAAPVAGQTCKMTIVGTAIEVFLDGISVFTTTDSSHASGSAGINADGPTSNAEAQLDNFEGGSLAAPPTTLTAGPGAYTLSGSAASLVHTRRLTAAPGVYAMAGSQATLVRSRTLTAQTGAYSWTGSAASLVRSRRLVAAPGAYTMAGIPASLIRGRTLTAQAGAYSLAGSAATLTRVVRLVASPGTYAMAGSPAGLQRAIRLTASAGSVLWTGTDATLTAGEVSGYAILDHAAAATLDGLAATTAAIDTTGASLVLVAVSSYQPGGLPVVSDSKANTWTLFGDITTGGEVPWVSVFGCHPGTFGAGHTFTVTTTGGYPSLCAVALSGGLTADALDQASEAGTGSNVLSIQPGSLTPTDDGAFVLAALSHYGAANVPTIDTGFAIVDRVPYVGGGVVGLAVASLIQPSAATVNPTWTWSESAPAMVVLLSFTAAPVGGAITLTADPGTYTLTGSPAGLVRTVRLTAASATYTLTGSAASLIRGRRLLANPGTYALTGTAASLTRSIRLTATPGAYALTGSPATFVQGQRLTAAPGAYVIAGSAASLTRTIRVTAAPGVYAWTGSPAGLSTGRRLTAAPGVYALAGSPASLTRTVRLQAGAGAYVWTGSAVISAVGLVLIASPGAYVWAGYGILERAPPSLTDADLALAFAIFDHPSRPPFWEGFDDPVEVIRLGQRAIQGRPLRPPRDG